MPDPGAIGYQAVLAQIYQAYEQRLPKSAKDELRKKGYVTPGRVPWGIGRSTSLLAVSCKLLAISLRLPSLLAQSFFLVP